MRRFVGTARDLEAEVRDDYPQGGSGQPGYVLRDLSAFANTFDTNSFRNLRLFGQRKNLPTYNPIMYLLGLSN